MRAMWNLWDDIPGMSLSFIPCKVAQDPFATLPALESGWVLRKWGVSLGIHRRPRLGHVPHHGLSFYDFPSP